MQLLRSLACAFALVASVAACNGRSGPGENAGLGAITSIAMTKSQCYGSCPSYAVRFSADGRATYAGGHFAPLRGRFSGVVDFPALAAWVATQHPETLRDRYPVGIDSQILTLTIDHGARRQTIVASSGLGPDIPLRLDGILLALDGETTRIHWRRDDAVTPFLGTFSGPPAANAGQATAVDIESSENGAFRAYAGTLRCGNAPPTLVRAGDALRLRCGTRSSMLHATADGFRADGDALPPGAYRRIDGHGASVLWGTRPEPRVAE